MSTTSFGPANRGGPAAPVRYEPRWPPVLTILLVLCLLAVLPHRFQLFPDWVLSLIVITLLVPMVGVGLSKTKTAWLRIERRVTLLFIPLALIAAIKALAQMIIVIVHHLPGSEGIPLLSSSVAIWVTNVLLFSLLYWQIDRGGPHARAHHLGVRPDWVFPEPASPEDVPPDWRPYFFDYLFLSYCTATAFSPTDTLPLTRLAKLLMMIESTLSLLTIVIVAARAVNILR